MPERMLGHCSAPRERNFDVEQWKNYFTPEQFYLNFVADDRFEKYILKGLQNTLVITLFAVLLGIVLGMIVGVIRSTNQKTGKLKILDGICRVYLSVIRGTPVVVQLMIMYYFIFATPTRPKLSVPFWPSESTPVPMWPRFSAPESCLWTTGSLRQEEVWDSITVRQSGTLFCRRHSKMCFRLSAMSLLHYLRKLPFPDS